MKVKFRKNNKVSYGQDHRFRKGVPSGIEFEIEKFTKERVRLIAVGYGDLKQGYGSGALYVNVKDLPTKVRQNFI